MSLFGHIGPANDRVIRIINVHYEANKDIIAKFLQGYIVVDQIRDVNPRTRTESTVYVLLGSVQERNAAVKALHNMSLLGRVVKLMPAPTGTYKSQCSSTARIH
jgi:hypothetical protein